MKLSPRGFGSAFGLVPPLAVASALGWVLRQEPVIGGTRQLSATESAVLDSDGDGLVDRLERRMFTASDNADSDGDGFSDLEELARQTSPLVPEALSARGRLRVGMAVFEDANTLQVTLAVYLPDMNLRNKDLRVGFASGSRFVELSRPDLLSMATIEFAPAYAQTALIALIRIPIAASVVQNVGELNVYATVGNYGTGVVAGASAIRLAWMDGVPVWCMPDPTFVPPSSGGNGGSNSMLPDPGSGQGAANSGTIFVPLLAPVDLPSTWTAGEICYQRSTPVGYAGALITQEVTRAECVANWDAYCAPSCSQSVGSTYDEVDPLALLGG